MFGRLLHHIRAFMAVEVDNLELLRAQLTALSRLIPLLYAILLGNAWVLAAAFFGKAPNWLGIDVALALSVFCAIRLAQWWRKRAMVFTLTKEQTAHELRRTNKVAVVLGLAFSSWAIALFPYGDAYAQSHVAVFLTMAMLGSMLCLIQLRSAALIVAATVSVPFVVFFAFSGVPTFLGIAINVTLVTIAVVIVILIQYRDFTRMVEAQKQTLMLSDENLRLANLDSLTDLPNRRAFFARLDKAFDRAQANGGRLALGIIDLDGFKPVNDLYGHAAGDRLLIQVAARLAAAFSGESFCLSRLGGDEFAYLVLDAPDAAGLIAQGDEFAAVLGTPFALLEATVQISGSIGIAVYPEMAESAQELFERADYALYHGKEQKRGSAVLFSAEHAAQISSDARIEQGLKRADFALELSVVFQPIVDIRSQAPVGFEALARWDSPLLGKVAPAQFIPVAERAGVVGVLTHILLEKALAVASCWPSGLRLSFNLSAFDLNSAARASAIACIIERSGFAADRLDLEITETAFTHDFAQIHRSVDMLRRLGCGISLDDFGTGYSSLSRLHALPLTKIKIDRSFVTGLHKSPNSLKIVKSLLALSRDMDIDCVIEGVETKEELAALKRLGGRMVQGYYYSRPIAADAICIYLSGRLVTAVNA